MFNESFAILKVLNQLNCPSVDQWRKKMWATHKIEYYSALKEENFSICDMVKPGGYYLC